MVSLYWTDEAKLCLKNIHDYIKLDNPRMAKNVIQNIRERAQILNSFRKLARYIKI